MYYCVSCNIVNTSTYKNEFKIEIDTVARIKCTVERITGIGTSVRQFFLKVGEIKENNVQE